MEYAEIRLGFKIFLDKKTIGQRNSLLLTSIIWEFFRGISSS